MYTISVLNKRGEYLVQTFEHKRSFQSMRIDICHRCTGVLIYCKRRPDASLLNEKYAVFGWNIPPSYGVGLRRVRKWLFKELLYLTKFYEPQSIYFCGGQTNNCWNDYLLLLALKKTLYPVLHLFPEAQFDFVMPDSEIEYSRMYMDRPNKIRFNTKKFKYITADM